MPSCQYIGQHAFYRCYSLKEVYAPQCKTISSYAFLSDSLLSYADFPECTIIGPYAFSGCASNNGGLSYGNFPKCTSVADYAFYGCWQLSSMSFPKLTRIGAMAFYGITASNVTLPSCQSIGKSAFYDAAIDTVNLPVCTYMSEQAFLSCHNLKTVYLGSQVNIPAYGFNACYRLLSLYLLCSSVITLANINAFSYTPLVSDYTSYTSGVNGSIYVPASLYNDYIAATNWVTYSDRFVSLTDSELSNLQLQFTPSFSNVLPTPDPGIGTVDI